MTSRNRVPRSAIVTFGAQDKVTKILRGASSALGKDVMAAMNAMTSRQRQLMMITLVQWITIYAYITLLIGGRPSHALGAQDIALVGQRICTDVAHIHVLSIRYVIRQLVRPLVDR